MSSVAAAVNRGKKAVSELEFIYSRKAVGDAAGFDYPEFKNLKNKWMNELKKAKTAYYNALVKKASPTRKSSRSNR